MANPVSDLMARLGGGDNEILEQAPGERSQFLQMAGVLLTTSSIAVLSMTFALNDGVKAPLFPSVLLGLCWGVIILNLDRFLVLSMGNSRTNKLRLVGIMVPRFALAVLLAAVISTPLVLRVFASDITREISVIHQENSKNFAALVAHSADQQEANKLKSEISTDQGILNGHLPQTITSQPLQNQQQQVHTLQTEARQAQQTENAKYEAWQCEIDGQTCSGGSGQQGNGARAHAKYMQYAEARNAYNQIENQLQSASGSLNSAQHTFTKNENQRIQNLQAQAKEALPGLTSKYSTLENKIHNTIINGDQANNSDTGILEQLQALSAASSQDSSLAAARWTVLALFFVIEVLPVSVKFLTNLGPESLYEKIARERAEESADEAHARRVENRRIAEDESQSRLKELQDRLKLKEIDSDTQVKVHEGKSQRLMNVEQDMRVREEDLGKSANEYVANEMTKILDLALKEWTDQIQDRLAQGETEASNGEKRSHEPQEESDYEFPDEDNL